MTTESATISDAGLKKTIGLYGAVALAVGIVLGAGLLSLPGLVYHQTGGWSVLAWLFDGLLVLPLLFVFAVLGRRFPSAGGVAGFVGQAFAGLKPGCSYVLFGAFSLGLPAIAITGAGYMATGLGLTGDSSERWIIAGIAAAIMIAVLAVGWLGSKFAGSVQNAVVTLLFVCLVLITLSAAPHWSGIDFSAGDPTWIGVFGGMSLAFFAYTGWEMLAFTAEEFTNPRRDFPLAVGISFVLVVTLYVGTALAVQALVTLDDPRLTIAPFLAVVSATIGGSLAIPVLTIIVLAIIVTNLNGATWAASRLMFDVGRSGWAPTSLGLHRLKGRSATPRHAFVALGVLLMVAVFLFGAGVLDLADLLRVAGQNFFLLYTLSIVAYIKIERRRWARAFGIASLAVCIAFAGGFGWSLLYACALFAAPYGVRKCAEILSRMRRRSLARAHDFDS